MSKTINIPPDFWTLPHRRDFQYFIPEWDDLVDPQYNFLTDKNSSPSGRAEYDREVYAHQIYPSPNYDGILVSRYTVDKTKRKKALLSELGGIHNYLRVPKEYPIMGDCGAFSYINEEKPPYSIEDVMSYYTGLGVDYGITLDHLVTTNGDAVAKYRYDLTLYNANQIIKAHKRDRPSWEPIAALQGWDTKTYQTAAQDCIKMGYRYLALGGVVRMKSPDIVKVLEAINEVRTPDTRVHVLGVVRLELIPDYKRLGVVSADSASYIRTSWLGAGKNYLTDTGEWYGAVRVPTCVQGEEEGSIRETFKTRKAVQGGESLANLSRLEKVVLSQLRDFDRENPSTVPPTLIQNITDLDTALHGRVSNPDIVTRTLTDRPWKHCPCPICKEIGVEVIIFRGNNRNRRRGFHNTYAFYKLLQGVFAGNGPLPEEDPF